MLIQVNVITRARTPGVIPRTTDHFTVKVTADPEGGKANEEVRRLLADHFVLPKSAIRIIRGKTTRKKIIEIKK